MAFDTSSLDDDDDIAEFQRGQKAARRRRALSWLVSAVAIVVGSIVAITVAWLDHSNRVERARSYARGGIVLVARGMPRDDPSDTTPSPLLMGGAGGIAGLVVFALGRALLLRDRTYMEGLEQLRRRSR